MAKEKSNGFIAVTPIKLSATETIAIGATVELDADEMKRLQDCGAIKRADEIAPPMHGQSSEIQVPRGGARSTAPYGDFNR